MAVASFRDAPGASHKARIDGGGVESGEGGELVSVLELPVEQDGQNDGSGLRADAGDALQNLALGIGPEDGDDVFFERGDMLLEGLNDLARPAIGGCLHAKRAERFDGGGAIFSNLNEFLELFGHGLPGAKMSLCFEDEAVDGAGIDLVGFGANTGADAVVPDPGRRDDEDFVSGLKGEASEEFTVFPGRFHGDARGFFEASQPSLDACALVGDFEGAVAIADGEGVLGNVDSEVVYHSFGLVGGSLSPR